MGAQLIVSTEQVSKCGTMDKWRILWVKAAATSLSVAKEPATGLTRSLGCVRAIGLGSATFRDCARLSDRARAQRSVTVVARARVQAMVVARAMGRASVRAPFARGYCAARARPRAAPPAVPAVRDWPPRLRSQTPDST